VREHFQDSMELNEQDLIRNHVIRIRNHVIRVEVKAAN
jgi:hypothetical protein